MYLREAMGDDFTAKDFRTWGATLRAIAIMHATPLPDPASERALKGCIADAVKQVANDLRNTPTVCRKSYINPLVFDAWRSGALHKGIGEKIAGAPRRAERLVPGFLRRQARNARRASASAFAGIQSSRRPRRIKSKQLDRCEPMRAAA
jgi:DNA topoisomerase IB